MFEREYRRPSAQEISAQEGEIVGGVSILLLKPEYQLLEIGEKEQLQELLEDRFFLNGRPLFIFPISINKSQAEELWRKDVTKYSWAELYYEHMATSSSVAFVLQGAETASLLKHQIRVAMSDSINRIKEELGSEFIPDIAHGSDPADGAGEFQMLVSIFLDNEDVS